MPSPAPNSVTAMQKTVVMDGCTAAAYVAFGLSDVATVYPITPIASMGQTAMLWGKQGKKNIFGAPLVVKEMESELGAAGATHGALCGGALATTFTASQGLMLMIPNMYKMAGELLPAVFHVGTRSLATHALSIFGDHQDVMACRATGFAFLASSNVQATHDLGIVAHLAAVEGRVPVCHFFDGWRTSNQLETIRITDYKDMAAIMPMQAVQDFRNRAMDPQRPDLRGTAQNPDVYFQNAEAANPYYLAMPGIVQKAMDKVAALTGRQYHLFDYVGAPDARVVLVSMGSSGEVIEQTLPALEALGLKVGVVKVRLYRPFDARALMAAIPQSVERLVVLDRTREPGAQGEPLYKDVCTAVMQSGRGLDVLGGRYGLSSKEFNPAMVHAVVLNALAEQPKREFTVGIDDDVTHLSLPPATAPVVPAEGATLRSVFYGFGSDGMVGATKQLARVMSLECGYWAQAYFTYSAKKSGGYTISELRLGHEPVRAEYEIHSAQYVACSKSEYVNRYDLAERLEAGGTFVLNSQWGTPQLWQQHVPAALLRALAAKKVRVYNIDATAIAAKHNLGSRVNMIMATAYLYLMRSDIDFNKALEALKQLVTTTYAHEGNQVVNDNLAAISETIQQLVAIPVPAGWARLQPAPVATDRNLPPFVRDVARKCDRLKGNTIPVSALSPDGVIPPGTTAYEKRRVAINIPHWLPDKCVQCTLCSFVCSHAAIRPFLLTAAQKAQAPAQVVTTPATGQALKGYQWRIQVYAEDCTGCGSCATVCPGRALEMVPLQQDMDTDIQSLDWVQQNVPYRTDVLPRFDIRGSQLQQPLMEFSGACGGCGETPYVKLLTQLFGERLVIANATGCSSIWGADFPSNPYTVNHQGHGPAWGNSLFEDNAEYGYGIAVALDSRRRAIMAAVQALQGSALPGAAQAKAWLENPSPDTAQALTRAIGPNPADANSRYIMDNATMLTPKSVWAIGGDGWAYDIGFAGVDHVLARRTNINLLVLDTECYSNTGGQMSKATPLGCVAKYAPQGKRTYKKDLGRMMMTYPDLYVAQISMGANPMQAIKALQEAEAYPGPSVVIAYCPCINHGIRKGMGNAMVEERNAVLSGYWQLYRRNPLGAKTFTLDYAAPNGKLNAFLDGEDRYADIYTAAPADAAKLRSKMAIRINLLYGDLCRLAQEKESNQNTQTSNT